MQEQLIDLFTRLYNSIGAAGVLSGIIAGFFLLSVYFSLRRKFNIFKRAERNYNRGKRHRALVLLSTLLEKKTSDKQALLMKADIERDQGDYASAEKDYYRLIDFKKSGDGIDVFEMKGRLLLPLYRQDKLLETLNLSGELLSIEKGNAEALYYLGLIFISQLYYKDAVKILERLIYNRPLMHQALFAGAVTLVQLKDFEKSLLYIKRALALDSNSFYKLIYAGIQYLMENYTRAKDTVKGIPVKEKALDTVKQFIFSLRLNAFCSSMLGLFDEAIAGFKTIHELSIKSKKNVEPGTNAGMVYDEFGKKNAGWPSDKGASPIIGQQSDKEVSPIIGQQSDKEASPIIGQQSDKGASPATGDSPLHTYFRLKEVAIDEGEIAAARSEGLTSSKQFLDLMGLSAQTRAALDVGLCLVKSGRFSEAHSFLKEIKTQHPEVLGMHKVLGLIEEQEKNVSGKKKGDTDYPAIRRSTEKIIKEKRGRYELWEYIREWEKNSIRPYHLLILSDITSKKQLSPILLLKVKDNFKLDF